jgi:hypothetical protein
MMPDANGKAAAISKSDRTGNVKRAVLFILIGILF